MSAPRHVVFVNRVYPPDIGATGTYLSMLASALVSFGWRLTVVATKAGAPATSKPATDGITVYRVHGLPFRRKPVLYRALAYLSLYPALLSGMRKVGRPDVIVVMSDPPLFFSVAAAYAAWRNIPLVHWCQDVYPELAFVLGPVRRTSIIGRALLRMRKTGLNRCNSIVVVGSCMAAALGGKTATEIRVVPNWADLEHIKPVPVEINKFRSELLAGADAQIVMYSGNFGLLHPFAAIVQAMVDLERRRPQTRFVLIGDGPRFDKLRAEIAGLGLKNALFLPRQPYSDLAQVLGAADVHLACMESDVLGLAVPSKVYGILAAGRPCIFLGPAESEVATLIVRAGAGEVLPPDRQRELGARLCHWLDHAEALMDASGKARRAAEFNGLSQAVSIFDQVLRDALPN